MKFNKTTKKTTIDLFVRCFHTRLGSDEVRRLGATEALARNRQNHARAKRLVASASGRYSYHPRRVCLPKLTTRSHPPRRGTKTLSRRCL